MSRIYANLIDPTTNQSLGHMSKGAKREMVDDNQLKCQINLRYFLPSEGPMANHFTESLTAQIQKHEKHQGPIQSAGKQQLMLLR